MDCHDADGIRPQRILHGRGSIQVIAIGQPLQECGDPLRLVEGHEVACEFDELFDRGASAAFNSTITRGEFDVETDLPNDHAQQLPDWQSCVAPK